jgi:hypothetical protein
MVRQKPKGSKRALASRFFSAKGGAVAMPGRSCRWLRYFLSALQCGRVLRSANRGASCPPPTRWNIPPRRRASGREPFGSFRASASAGPGRSGAFL